MWGWIGGRKKEPEVGVVSAASYERSRRETIELERKVRRLEKDGDGLRARIGELEAPAVGDGVPHLRPAEIERLALLADGCGSLCGALAKVLRHGWESESPHTGRTNRAVLEREIGSLRAVVNLMIDSGDLGLAQLQGWQRTKRTALGKWTHHQADSVSREEMNAAFERIAAERTAR